jgi:hypothetical protein
MPRGVKKQMNAKHQEVFDGLDARVADGSLVMTPAAKEILRKLLLIVPEFGLNTTCYVNNGSGYQYDRQYTSVKFHEFAPIMEAPSQGYHPSGPQNVFGYNVKYLGKKMYKFVNKLSKIPGIRGVYKDHCWYYILIANK